MSAGKVDMWSLQVRREKRYQDGEGGARRRTANFAMISVYRRARSICGHQKVRREKRYQDGAERDEKKDCKFCDDFGISAGKVNTRGY